MVVRVRNVNLERIKLQTAIHRVRHVPHSRRRHLGALIRFNACVIVDTLDKMVVCVQYVDLERIKI